MINPKDVKPFPIAVEIATGSDRSFLYAIGRTLDTGLIVVTVAKGEGSKKPRVLLLLDQILKFSYPGHWTWNTQSLQAIGGRTKKL